MEREAGEHLGKELQARDELLNLNSAECQSLQEQLSTRIEEVNTLEEQARLLKMDVSDREKREAYAQNLVCLCYCLSLCVIRRTAPAFHPNLWL